MKEISIKLEKLKRFKEIRSSADNASGDENTFRLSGTIVKFRPGNRTARYLVGFGSGRKKIIAEIRFTDSKTGETLLKKNVEGDVFVGILGGKSSYAERDLAGDVANTAELVLLRQNRKVN
jgi:hypothetical protein